MCIMAMQILQSGSLVLLYVLTWFSLYEQASTVQALPKNKQWFKYPSPSSPFTCMHPTTLRRGRVSKANYRPSKSRNEQTRGHILGVLYFFTLSWKKPNGVVSLSPSPSSAIQPCPMSTPYRPLLVVSRDNQETTYQLQHAENCKTAHPTTSCWSVGMCDSLPLLIT